MAIFSTTFLIMLAASIVVLVIGLVLIDFDKVDRKKYYLILVIGFITTRILSVIYLFGIAGITGTSDLNNIFGYQANQVLQGHIPYLDFESHYSPYFPYLILFPYLFNNQPVSILSVFVAFDFLTLVVGGMYVQETWNFKYKHKFFWIYSFVPMTWLFIVFWNQDEVVSALFITLSMFLVQRNQEWKASICMAIGYLVTKFLILVFFIPIFLMMKEPIRKGLLTVGLILLGYLPFIFLGADVLMPFTSEVGYSPVGSNPWVMIDALGIAYPWYLPHVVVLICLAALSILYLTSDRLHYLRPESTIVLFSLVYMLFGKKSFSFYIPFFLVFMIILFMRLYSEHENRRMLVGVFFAYLISFSLLYQSVVVLKMMQIATFDWFISVSIYLVATISQVLLIWILAGFQDSKSKFYYYRIGSVFRKHEQ